MSRAARSLLSEAGLPADGLEDQFGDSYVLGIEDGEVLGLAGVEVHGTSGLLRSVAVSPRYQRTGLGRRLVEDRVKWARARCPGGLYLLTETAPGFFRSCGFHTIPRDRAPEEIRNSLEFTRVCPETATTMVLELEG